MRQKTAITNVRIFDGHELTAPRTIVIDDGKITDASPDDATSIIDGNGGTLVPGFIDCHVHLVARSDLTRASYWGVTTLLDMGTPDMAFTNTFRNQSGAPTVLGSGPSASAPGGLQTTKMRFPPSTALATTHDAARFVADRIAEGADHIKVIVEDPTKPASLPPAIVEAIVAEAHRANLKVVAHISTKSALELAQAAGVDVVTHAPLDADIGPETAAAFVSHGTVSAPTLIMMKSVVENEESGGADRVGSREFRHALHSVSMLHAAGVQIIAGTDSNIAPGSPAQVPHGKSMHDELALLVQAGLSPLEALRSATVVPAEFFGLADRGTVEVGKRADLVLLNGNPIDDISATRQIAEVWITGERVPRPSHEPKVPGRLGAMVSMVALGIRSRRTGKVPPEAR